MGDPKKSRRKWEGPGMPWLSQALKSEQEIMGKYGLRNKKEIWLARTIVTGYRHMARSLLALPPAERAIREKQLLGKLYRIGLLKSEQSSIDDVLGLEEESLLERRLQTLVHRKGLARTIYQARQLIVHGHIAVGGRKITSPGYIVKRDEEDSIDFYPVSPFKANPPTMQQGEVNVEQKGN